MTMLRVAIARIAALFRRRVSDAELDDEIGFHIDMETEKNVRAGMNAAEARRYALAHFGGVQSVRETHRDGRRIAWLEDTLADARFAARSLRRTPGVTAAIVLTLALGLGANAAIFSVLDRIFFRMPAGIAAPENVLRLYEVPNHADSDMPAIQLYGYPKYAGIRAAVGNKAQVTTYVTPSMTRLDDDGSEAFSSMVGAGYFSLLGVRPALGRFFAADEERVANPADVIVLSYDYWENRFAGDRSVLGRQLRIGGHPYTIIGVAQKGFAGVDLDATDLWQPLSTFARVASKEAPWYEMRDMYFLEILARPAEGATASAVEARATIGLQRDARQAATADSFATIATGSLIASRGPARLPQSQEFALSVRIAGIALIVLLIACANVANLLLARATERRHEIAVRLAMGISRGRLVRMLLTESTLLAMLAGAAAYVAALWSGGLLRRLLLPDAHWEAEVHGARLVAFTVGAALFVACATALVPVFQSRSHDLTGALKSGTREGGGHRTRLRTLLVVAQSAAAALLVIGAGLFVRSLHNVVSQRIGYDVDRLSFVAVTLPEGLRGTPAEMATANDVAAQLARIPNVEGTALVTHPPFYATSFLEGPFRENGDTLWRRGQRIPRVTGVSPSFFSTVGMRVLRGRIFGASAPREVVINDAMARSYWPGKNPLGECIRFERQLSAPCYTIVGIVETGHEGQITEKPQPEYYLPINLAAVPRATPQWSRGSPPGSNDAAWIVVRAAANRVADVAAIMRPLVAHGPNGSEGHVMIMSEMIAPQLHAWRLGAWLFTALALLALIVAAMGVFSTLMYTTVQRTHEIGVRMALGARRIDVAGVVIRSGVMLAGAGVVIGMVLALGLGRLIGSFLYGVTAHDPVTIVGAGLVLAGVSAVAAAVPAWRATRVDPVIALRGEA